MKKPNITELVPSSSRKSFYGKAKVIENGKARYLLSYDTIVASVDRNGKIHRHWDGKTATTSRHVASFLKQFARACSTKDFYAIPCENAPALTLNA